MDEDFEQKILAEQYKAKLIELAKEESYIIPLQDLMSGGTRIPNPFFSSDRKKQKFITVYTEWEKREYKRHKITISDHEKAEELVKQYEEAIGEGEEEEEVEEEKIDRVIALYQFLAFCYLKMPPDEFQRSDWGTIRPVLDACQFRTSHSLADLSRGVYEYFHFGKARLTANEFELIKMYRLWTGKAKTKPWEINGGIVYEEDINAILKLEELDISGQNLRAKKERARGGGGGKGRR